MPSTRPTPAELLRYALIIIALTLAARLPLAVRQAPPVVTGTESTNLAMSVAQHGTYSDALGQGTGATAHLLPGSILPQALVMKIFGFASAGAIALRVLACLEVALGLAVLPLVGLLLFSEPRIGVVAGLLGAGLPFNWYSQTSGQDEATLAFMLVCFSMLIFAYFFCGKRIPTGKQAMLTGVFLGFFLLVTASILPVLGLVFLLGFRSMGLDAREYFKVWAKAGLMILVVMSPWILRNYAVFDKFIPFRSNLGLELQVSNNEAAQALAMDNQKTLNSIHPLHSNAERRRLKSVGEIAYNAAKTRMAVEWIARNPSRFAMLSLEHVWFFWFPRFTSGFQDIVCWGITVLSVFGLYALFARRHGARWFLLSYLAGFSAIYTFIQASGRYRFPLEPILLLLAALAIDACLRGTRKARADETAWRDPDATLSSGP